MYFGSFFQICIVCDDFTGNNGGKLSVVLPRWWGEGVLQDDLV